MPKFPRREADILALCDAMIAGYAAHPSDFPSYSHTGPPLLRIRRSQYVTTKQRKARLAALVKVMQAELKKSEADVGADSEKLKYIGWVPRKKATRKKRR